MTANTERGLTTEELRKCATAVYLAAESSVAEDIAKHLLWAAHEIDRLAAAESPSPQEAWPEGAWETLDVLLGTYGAGERVSPTTILNALSRVGALRGKVDRDGLARFVNEFANKRFGMAAFDKGLSYGFADALIAHLDAQKE